MSLPLPTKPAVGSTINTGHSVASGLQRCILFNEGSGSPEELVGSGLGTLTNGTVWNTDSDLGGTCIDFASAVNSYVDFGSNGLSFGNGNVSVFFAGRTVVNALYHIAGGMAGAATDTYGFGIHDSGNWYWVIRDVIENESTLAATNNNIYTAGIGHTKGGNTRFNVYNQNTDVNQTQTFVNTSSPVQIASTSNVGNHDLINGSWRNTFALLYIWNRVLADSEFDQLHANPYLFINAPVTALPFITTIGAKRI
jgi:hypothetical protein